MQSVHDMQMAMTCAAFQAGRRRFVGGLLQVENRIKKKSNFFPWNKEKRKTLGETSLVEYLC